MEIIIFGQRSSSSELGNFAKAIVAASKEFDDVTILEPQELRKPDIIVYASRTSSALKQAVDLAQKRSIPLLVVSTDIKGELQQYEDKINLHYYPNTSLHTIEFMDDVTLFHAEHPDWYIASFTEWHQVSKQSISGTAVAIAETINLDTKNIIMVRDDQRAYAEMSIPKDTKAYAIHTIVFNNKHETAQRTFSLTTIGRDEYARGVLEIARGLV